MKKIEIIDIGFNTNTKDVTDTKFQMINEQLLMEVLHKRDFIEELLALHF